MNRKKIKFLPIQYVNRKVKLSESNGFLLFLMLLEAICPAFPKK